MAKPIKKASTVKKPLATTAKSSAPKKKLAPVKKIRAASYEQIAELAHRYWAERGHQHGSHEQDWHRAEQELLGKAS